MDDNERLSPVILEGQQVRLEPLTRRRHADLAAAGADASIWTWLPSAHTTPDAMADFIAEALTRQERGDALPFAIVERTENRAIGSTRYHAIEMRHRRLEIGVTWITPRFQRTAINTEAKYLLLRHAFEALGYRRVEFKADAHNTKSCQALLRIGAVREGIFRKHMLYPDGRVRDSVYFSIIDEEWPGVRRGLEDTLARHRDQPGAGQHGARIPDGIKKPC